MWLGESTTTCVSDCPVCNHNGVCQAWQDAVSCPDDCGPHVVVAGGGGLPAINPVPPQILNLRMVNTGTNSAAVGFETDVLAHCQIFWGDTTDYFGGSLSEISFVNNHQMSIPNLNPNTTYHFKVRCYNTSQIGAETSDVTFTTSKMLPAAEMPNVINAGANSGNKTVTLSWLSPPGEPDYMGVYITRSAVFYPANKDSGILVYQGMGAWTSALNKFVFTDTGLINGVRYYYTIFAYDKNGRIASGAVLSATPQLPVKIIPPAGETTTVFVPVSQQGTGPAVPTGTVSGTLIFKDFDFAQDLNQLPVAQDTVNAKADSPVSVGLKNYKIPAAARSSVVTFENIITKQKFSYIFKSDVKKDIISSIYFSSKDAGTYNVSIVFFDYRNKAIQQVTGTVIFQPIAEEIKYTQTIIKAGGCAVPKILAKTMYNHPVISQFYQTICPWWPLAFVIIFVGGALFVWRLLFRLYPR
jgi:hypothetical protein